MADVRQTNISSCPAWYLVYSFGMSVEEIKKGLVSLSENEQREVTAFLFHIRHSHGTDYQSIITARSADADPSHWVTPEEFQKRLDQQ